MTTGFTRLIINSHERLERLKKRAETEDITKWKDADKEAYLDYMKDPKDRKGKTVTLDRSKRVEVADMSRGKKWSNREYGILIDGYMAGDSIEAITEKLPKRGRGSVVAMINHLDLPNKYYEKHGLEKPLADDSRGKPILRRKGAARNFTNDEEWVVWYLKHNTNLSNREIGEYLGRSKQSINSVVNTRSLLTTEPQGERPANLAGIVERIRFNGMTLEGAAKEAAAVCQ